MEKNEFVDIIISSLKDIISEQDEDEVIPLKSLDESTHLLGKQAILDSLSLVSMIVDVEEKINEKYGTTITIADERALSQEKSPFRTVKTLAQYIQFLVDEKIKND
jgi:acyl carrier protein